MPPLARKLPLPVLRDLIAIARALFLVERERGADPSRLARLEQCGKELSRAYDLGKLAPDTLGHRAAWSRAEKALEDLALLIGEDIPLRPAFDVTRRRLR